MDRKGVNALDRRVVGVFPGRKRLGYGFDILFSAVNVRIKSTLARPSRVRRTWKSQSQQPPKLFQVFQTLEGFPCKKIKKLPEKSDSSISIRKKIKNLKSKTCLPAGRS